MSELITEEKDLLDKEEAYIRKIRAKNTRADQPAALAISGGGIRSASFALGALQALQNVDLIEKFDYLSTVSGGGYIGSCLTWFQDQLYRASKAKLGTLLGKNGRGARSLNSHDILGYLRQHGKYLTPGQGLDLISALGVVLRSMLLGFAVYFLPLIALFYLVLKVCKWLVSHSPDILSPLIPVVAKFIDGPGAYLTEVSFVIAVALILYFGVAAICFSLGTCRSNDTCDWPYKFRRGVQKRIGLALKILLSVVVVGTIPLVVALVGEKIAALVAGSAAAPGYLLAMIKFILETRKVNSKDSKLTSLVVPGAALLLIYGLLLGGYLAGSYLVTHPDILPWGLLALLLSLLLARYVNLNYVSLHRMYRDRLMEMFLPDLEAVCTDTWQPATEANTRKLQSFKISDTEANNDFPGPFQIINTNLIQVDAEDAKYRGRGGDNFILTPLYCGSNATGWRDTENFNRGTMTLATAMAVSGAAASPHAGPSGQGPTRNALVSFLMSFLNISLGYWACNPRENSGGACPKPNYFCPGLINGLLGQGYNEKSKFIELSDGGHFENLALYELIRRRVKTIIVTDGGADLDFNFSDLANAVEKVRADFGVVIDFPAKGAPICDLLPNSGGEKSLYKEKYNLARRGYAIGTIKYPEIPGNPGKTAFEGQIFYIKATLTGGLPEDIYGYKSSNPDFPNQTTADQFFDESQFEAYRELGYQHTKKMLAETKVLQGGVKSWLQAC